MPTRHIFHLSVPVSDLASARRFYVEVLGATVGRQRDDWIDVLLWGHQITLHLDPHRVASESDAERGHFGVVLPWEEWERQADRIERIDEGILEGRSIRMPGTDDEHAKLYLSDPSGNVIEIKAYRNVARTLGLEP